VLCAYIPLLEVLPAYQHQGIGATLFARMKDRLRNYYAIDLLCDEAVQPFYQRLGMQPMHGMGLRNYARQSGRAEEEVS
jgi:GNAT superfamily N-acetyltransferase